jgi:hypothetical protein
LRGYYKKKYTIGDTIQNVYKKEEIVILVDNTEPFKGKKELTNARNGRRLRV